LSALLPQSGGRARAAGALCKKLFGLINGLLVWSHPPAAVMVTLGTMGITRGIVLRLAAHR
jgi:ribose/xylose/arabinose/galactoside ABC-type transport system permease subunit